jgi:hypothetical protein
MHFLFVFTLSVLAIPAPQDLPLAVVYPPQGSAAPSSEVPPIITSSESPASTPVIQQNQPQQAPGQPPSQQPDQLGEELDCEETLEFDQNLWDCQETDIAQINRDEFDCWEETDFDQDFDCVEDDGDFICDEDVVPGSQTNPTQTQNPPSNPQDPPPPATFDPESPIATPTVNPQGNQSQLPQINASRQMEMSLISCLLGLVMAL